MRITRFPAALECAAALCFCLVQPAGADDNGQTRHTFYLEGGFFYGPGPIVPDTKLPGGRLANIHFDVRSLTGYCEFANDGKRQGLLSDGVTRVNQNIDAGRLLIGGGTSPILLTAVEGGPHQGTERYYLDDHYRFVWRVDIALDPGFPEGIIRLNDFVLNTGVVRVERSLQTQRGEPGGYDQAGSLPAGSYLAGRVGDFDQDGFLDGILVAAPHVPLAADMLPGAPVGNKRGFRTDVPIAPNLSAELMLRGATLLLEPLVTTLAEHNQDAADALAAELVQRIEIARVAAQKAVAQNLWHADAHRAQLGARLDDLRRRALAVSASIRNASDEGAANKEARAISRAFDGAVDALAALNAATGATLPHPSELPAATASMRDAFTEPRQKNY